MLEARFYQLAHTDEPRLPIARDLRRLLELGIRLAWDVSANVEYVSRSDPGRAKALTDIEKMLRGDRAVTNLEAEIGRLGA